MFAYRVLPTIRLLFFSLLFFSCTPLQSTIHENATRWEKNFITVTSTDSEVILTHYLLDGSKDHQFGIKRKWIMTLPASIHIQCADNQDKDKIIIGGSENQTGTPQFYIARYDQDKTLDQTFGINGIAERPFNFGVITTLSTQPDGKILAAGFTVHQGHTHLALMRYNTDGMLDLEFGHHGTTIIPLGTYAQAHSITKQPDGKIIVTATAKIDGVFHCALMRCYHDGTLDKSFGHEGIVIQTTAAGAHTKALATTVQSDGKMLVAVSSQKKLILIRFHEDGTPAFTSDNHILDTIEQDIKIISLEAADKTLSIVRAHKGDISILNYIDGKLSTPDVRHEDIPKDEITQEPTSTRNHHESASPCLPKACINDRNPLSKLQLMKELAVVGSVVVIGSLMIPCVKFLFLTGRITGYIPSPRKWSIRRQNSRIIRMQDISS